jgi:hypothetical protein
MTIAEEAVVANAVEARGQDVQEKPADEFGRVERHRLLALGAARGSPCSGRTWPSSMSSSRSLEMATRWV